MNNSVSNFIHCLSYLLRLQQIVSVTYEWRNAFCAQSIGVGTLPNELLMPPYPLIID